MNLVVVARRPELAERCAATIQALTGRHPSRTIVIQSADPDGPSWLDARVEAHCVLPREDAPETCAETIHLTARRRGRPAPVGDRDAADHPRPAGHGLVAGRAAARAARPALRPARRAPTASSSTARPGAATASTACARWPSSSRRRRLAISDFALVRQSRWREAIASIFDDPDFLPYLRSLRRIAVTYATHDETGAPGLDEPRQADLPRRLAGLAAGADGGQAARRGRRAAPARRAAARPRGRRRPSRSAAAGSRATLSDGRAEVAVVVRPVVSTMPAGHDPAGRAARRAARLRAAGRRDRRGRDRPRPRLAGRRRGPRPPFPGAPRGARSTCWPRRSSPAGATRSRSARCVRPLR